MFKEQYAFKREEKKHARNGCKRISSVMPIDGQENYLSHQLQNVVLWVEKIKKSRYSEKRDHCSFTCF